MSEPWHAVVTGGGSGIGLAIARGLGDVGYRVTVMGRNRERLDAARAFLSGGGLQLCDVTDEASVERAFAGAVADAGPVQVLVNCAGIVRTASFEKTAPPVWDELWRTNVMGAVHTSRTVLPAMRQLPYGRIINIASTASLKPYAYVSAYVATKHALLGVTRAMALELSQTAITVNAICPGYADTEIIRESIETIRRKTGRSEAEALRTFTEANPQGRLIAPAEIAASVVFLAAEAAQSITGQALAVAGGEIM